MKATRFLGLMILANLSILGVSASEEDYVPWAEVKIVGPAHSQTGVVVFHAKCKKGQIAEITLEAFGKSYAVDGATMAKVKHYPLQNIRLTHEAGYERLGGHTVHFQLSVDRFDKDRRRFGDRAILSVSKGKGLTTSFRTDDPEKK